MKANELEIKFAELLKTLKEAQGAESSDDRNNRLRWQIRELRPYIDYFVATKRLYPTVTDFFGRTEDVFDSICNINTAQGSPSLYCQKAQPIIAAILEHIRKMPANDDIDPYILQHTRVDQRLAALEWYPKAAKVAISFLGISIIGALAWLGSLQSKASNIDTEISSATKDALVAIDKQREFHYPPGTIIAFAGAIPPPGWLLCDGMPRSSKDYPSLFDAIKQYWGSGSGNGGSVDIASGPLDFNVPDLRGQFLRGSSPNSKVDPEGPRQVGSYQEDEFKRHDHEYLTTGSKQDRLVPAYKDEPGILSTRANTSQRGGDETRPKNAAVNWIVKY